MDASSTLMDFARFIHACQQHPPLEKPLIELDPIGDCWKIILRTHNVFERCCLAIIDAHCPTAHYEIDADRDVVVLIIEIRLPNDLLALPEED